jgi:myo-inositol-1(or 4)-monophosphatase
MTDDNEARLRFARELAISAGDVGLTYFRALDTLTIESKGHQDLVSEADRDVETFIRTAIAEQYPDDGVVGEEHANVAGTSGYVWVIDPIDGTANFVRGIPAWTVVIAGVRQGVIDVGVIHEPSTAETFYGRHGGGAFLNGKPIRTSAASDLTAGSVGTGFSNRREPRHVARLIDLILAEGGVFYRNASGALMLAYVAAGRLLAYAEEHMNAWDCLAGLLLVEEAGGRILQPVGETVVLDGTMVIAGGAGVFDQVQALCEKSFNP